MLDFDDAKWLELEGGYRRPVDLRPFLVAIETTGGSPSAWDALAQALYHQGDVGVGSYAAVPHLVQMYRKGGRADWRAYALVGSIEVARGRVRNPPVPGWAQDDYESALQELAGLGLSELPTAPNQETVVSILAVLALAFGASVYGRFLVEFTADEAADVISEKLGE